MSGAVYKPQQVYQPPTSTVDWTQGTAESPAWQDSLSTNSYGDATRTGNTITGSDFANNILLGIDEGMWGDEMKQLFNTDGTLNQQGTLALGNSLAQQGRDLQSGYNNDYYGTFG